MVQIPEGSSKNSYIDESRCVRITVSNRGGFESRCVRIAVENEKPPGVATARTTGTAATATATEAAATTSMTINENQ